MLNVIDNVGRYVALPALLGILLLIPLYVSQRRDVLRLRLWMDREPDHPASDITASEALLDRAEADLEEVFGDGAPAATVVQTPTAGMTPIPAAQRVTVERPALTRITMERAALEPHPRWRRLRSRVSRPWTLALIALAAVLLAAVAVLVTRSVVERNTSPPERQTHAGAVAPREVSVAVLNGTSVPSLAAKVSQTMHENGFKQGPIGTSRKQYQQTVVMYGGGEKKAAERVAHVLGVTPIQRIDKTTRAIVGSGADVVVIAGADRTGR
jgi:LytR cell envelope-related transcriptional attenuator